MRLSRKYCAQRLYLFGLADMRLSRKYCAQRPYLFGLADMRLSRKYCAQRLYLFGLADMRLSRKCAQRLYLFGLADMRLSRKCCALAQGRGAAVPIRSHMDPAKTSRQRVHLCSLIRGFTGLFFSQRSKVPSGGQQKL